MSAAKGALRKLWERDPHCHWCGRATLLIEPKSRKLAATRDHIITKRTGGGHRGRPVLSCMGCNAQRARDENLLTTQRRIKGARAKILRLIAEGVQKCSENEVLGVQTPDDASGVPRP
jgi:5-methylcytosine-specific restriction endonuclease McrA